MTAIFSDNNPRCFGKQGKSDFATCYNILRFLLVSQPEAFATDIVTRLVRMYLRERDSDEQEKKLRFKAFLEASKTLMTEIEYLTDNTEELVTVRHLWNVCDTWALPGLPRVLYDTYDKYLDAVAIGCWCPSVAHFYVAARANTSSLKTLMAHKPHLHSITRICSLPFDIQLHDMCPRFRGITFESLFHDDKYARSGLMFEFLETPTTLAMYTSDVFFDWKTAIFKDSRDEKAIKKFVEKELDVIPFPKLETHWRNFYRYCSRFGYSGVPLLHYGWTAESLMRLFQTKFTASQCYNPNRPCLCGRNQPKRLLKQPLWLRFLGSIKNNGGFNQHAPEDTEDTRFSDKIPQADTPGMFCMPGHRGCYLCQWCWPSANIKADFWPTRDLPSDLEIPAIEGFDDYYGFGDNGACFENEVDDRERIENEVDDRERSDDDSDSEESFVSCEEELDVSH